MRVMGIQSKSYTVPGLEDKVEQAIDETLVFRGSASPGKGSGDRSCNPSEVEARLGIGRESALKRHQKARIA